MTRGASAQRHKDQVAIGAAVVSAIAAALIWMLWVVPIATSVEHAEPQPIGTSRTVELDHGQAAGIWATGRAAWLGTAECMVLGPDGSEQPLTAGPSLNWEDTLWWMTPRAGFEQILRFASTSSGAYEVRCADRLDTYDGEFLVAGDSFGAGAIGLGRGGSSDFPVGSILAFCAVVLPLFSVLIVPVIALRRLRDRRRSGRVS